MDVVLHDLLCITSVYVCRTAVILLTAVDAARFGGEIEQADSCLTPSAVVVATSVDLDYMLHA